MTFRAKTLWAMLLVGLPLACFGGGMLAVYERRLMHAGIRGFVEGEVLAAAEEIENRLDAREKLLRLLASTDAARRYLEAPSYDGPVYDALLRNLRALVACDRAISLAYVQSATSFYHCCQSDGLPPDERYTPVGQPWYDLPVARRGFVVTPPYLEEAGESLAQTGKPMVSAALPVYDASGRLSGVAAVDLLLCPHQHEFFQPPVPRARGSLFVLAADGTVLHRPHSPGGGGGLCQLESVRDYPVAARVFAGGAPVLRLRDPESGAWLWGGAGIVRRTGWRVVMVFPEEALAPEFREFERSMAGLGAALAAVFVLLSVLVSGRISRLESEALGGCARYREMFARAPAAVLMADADGRVEAANEAFLALTGAAAEGLLGRTLAGIVHPEDSAAARGLLAAASHKGGASAEIRFLMPDGTPVACKAAAAPLRGTAGGAIVVARDAAREKSLALRLEKVEAELQYLNRIMVQREFRVKELRERVRDLEGRREGTDG